uniref:Uncharacterized protein n=1 Tax=Macrostomum lignano TaxID=282301 RepID=A0A1I8FSA5_9PLAT
MPAAAARDPTGRPGVRRRPAQAGGISQSPASESRAAAEAAPGGDVARWPAGGRRLGRQRLGRPAACLRC